MVNNNYAKAYTEVLEIIKHFPKEEYQKIPNEKILFFEANMDKNYDFKIDPKICLEKQNISEEANAIIIILTMVLMVQEIWCTPMDLPLQRIKVGIPDTNLF